MTNDADLNLLLMTEVFMIVHFACDKGISTSLYGSVKKKRASTTAESHAPDRMTKQLITLHTFYCKLVAQQEHQIIGSPPLCFGHFAYYSFATFHAIHFFLACKELQVLQPQFLCYLKVDSTRSRIHIGMHAHDGNVVLDGFTHSALHIVLV